MDIKDGVEVAKAFISPLEKLITTVSTGIGKAYEPIHIKRIANSVRDNIDIPIKYDDGKVSIDSTNFQELAQRASSRMAFQEITKQQNIDNIIYNASEELKNTKEVSNEPVDKDWIFRFFNSVENISNEELQKVWGRILAGEIKAPNSYSYRTMEILKNMTQSEIETFQKIAKFSIFEGSSYFITENKEILNKYNLFFMDILLMVECGLISTQTLSWTPQITKNKSLLFSNDKVCALASSKKDENLKIRYSAYKFTNSGQQLLEVISSEKEEEYFVDCVKDFIFQNQNIDINIHEMTYSVDHESLILGKQIF